MVDKVEALIKPELLIWARKSAGFEVAVVAKKIGVKPEKLYSWESGIARPTIGQLRKLGEVYKRPLAVFYLPEPPKEVDVLHDFRKLPSGKAGEYAPELRFEIRRAKFRREVALDLYDTLEGEPVPLALSASTSEQPDAVAEKVRQFLGVTVDQQLRWKDDYEALNGWRRAIEEKDILVFQASGIPIEEMRGFSLSAQPLPVIVLNIKDSPAARVFTLIHELTHLLLGQEGVCDFHEAGIEVFCNAVAGSTLVPKDSFMAQPETREKTAARKQWFDEDISLMSSRFRVSRQVILRRLLAFSLITESEYREQQAIYRAQASSQKESTGGPKPHIKAIAASGNLFTRLVLAGYYRDRITGADLSDYLSIRLKHLAALESALR